MSSDVDDFGFGLVVVFGFLKFKCFFFLMVTQSLK